MPYTPYTAIDTNRIRTTNADLDRRWKTLKAELDAQYTYTAQMIVDTRKIVDDTKWMLEESRQCLHSKEESDTPIKP